MNNEENAGAPRLKIGCSWRWPVQGSIANTIIDLEGVVAKNTMVAVCIHAIMSNIKTNT